MDVNLYATMNKAKYSERLTDYVLWRTWREEVKRSVRSIKAMFASLHTFVISGIRHA